MVKLLASEKERVKAAIVAAEQESAGEIRVLVVERSTGPHWISGAVVAVIVATLVHFVWRWQTWGYPDLVQEAIALGAGLVAGFVTAEVAGRVGKARAVHRRAEREFVRLGIARTSAHTGVLVMLSTAERRAVLLADRAIHEKVEDGTWDAIVARLTSALREGRAADGLEAAVGEVGRVLARHLPKTPKGTNELSDEVEEAP